MSQAPAITGVEGERLVATVTVDSTFSSQQTQTIELRIEDGGTVVHTDTQDVTLTDSTDSQQITLSWATSAGDAGVYDLFVESEQDTIQRLVEVTDSTAPTFADNHWPFNEGGGSVAADTIGSFDADFGSAISWGSDGDGKGGTYGILDGSAGASLGSASQSHWSHWVNSGVGGVGGWINTDAVSLPDDPDRKGIFGTSDAKGQSGRLSFEVALYKDILGISGYLVRVQVGTSSGLSDTFELAGSVTANAWESWAVRADGSQAELFINGSVADSASVGATESGDLVEDVYIGANGETTGREFEGGIDDLWSDQSDPGEQAIQNWYNATKGNYS